jgi:ribonuclease VapC
VVLDASALLAMLFKEPGADLVRRHVRGASLGVANLAEVLAKLTDCGVEVGHGLAALAALELDIRPMTASQASLSAEMRAATRAAGLSLADRACLALAKEMRVPVLTADRLWTTVAAAIGVQIQLIR